MTGDAGGVPVFIFGLSSREVRTLSPDSLLPSLGNSRTENLRSKTKIECQYSLDVFVQLLLQSF